MRFMTRILPIVLCVVTMGRGQTPNGLIDFGNTSDGTTATTTNTGFGGVRIGTGGGSFTLQNTGQEIGVQAELRGIAPTGGSINSVGITSTEFGTAAQSFTVAFEVYFSGGSSGTWYFFAGNGASFGAAQSSGFTGSQVFAGLRFVYGASDAITVNNRNAGSWNATGITGTPFAQNISYTVTIVGNNSSSSIDYGSGQSVASNTHDLWVNGVLIGDDLAKAQIPNATDVNAFRFYGESSTGNVATIALDNIRWWNSCVAPSMTVYAAITSIPANTYSDLNVNSGSATFAGNVSVARLLTLSSGLLTLGTNNLTIASGGSISVSGSIPTSYIVTNGTGSLKQTVSGSDVLFPIGTTRTTSGPCPATTSYNGVTLNNTGGTSDVYSVRVKEGWDNSPVDPGGTVRRQWTITEDASGGSNVTTTFIWNNDASSACGDTDIPQGTPAIGKWVTTTSTWWPFAATLAVVSSPYTKVTSDAPFTSFSDFSVGGSSALPIQLASFTAVQVQGQGVRLNWRTISEVNNYGFYVQRKRQNETGWTEIPNSFVAGHGTTNEPQNYSFTDNSVAGGLWQYRLRQVDLDGTTHFSEPISIDILTSVEENVPARFALFQNYPNPFNPSTTIKFAVENVGHAQLDLYDITGQKVATLFSNAAEPGRYYTATFDGSKFSSGVYFYRLQSGRKTAVKKLMLMQ